ncbi:hypothetical protein C7959_101145 [Orenia marismortui]|uniref:Phosphatidylglycerol lysyltransferase n=2 Tax=Orenia marismortui TaxID=46469 RepID=A0A4R8HID4_9FIRM|nr:hypothetical protein C7959_101145 [Orenia marismortui]
MISLMLGIAIIVYMVSRLGMNKFLEGLKNINLFWVIAAILIYIIDMAVRALRWKSILQENEIKISLTDSFLAYGFGNFVNLIVPAKIGDISRSYYLNKKYNYTYISTLTSIGIDRFFDFIGVFSVIYISSLFILKDLILPIWIKNLIQIMIIVILSSFILLYLIKKGTFKIKNANNKIKKVLKEVIAIVNKSFSNKKSFVKWFLLSLAIWFLDGIVTFLVFVSVAQYLNPFLVVFANMISNLTKVFPITPGGLGVFEGTMVILFDLFNIQESQTILVASLDHFIMNAVTFCIGFSVLVINGIKVSKIMVKKVSEHG